VSANLCPPIPQNFSDAIDRKIIFDDSENDVIENFEQTQLNNECLTNLFLEFFLMEPRITIYMYGLLVFRGLRRRQGRS